MQTSLVVPELGVVDDPIRVSCWLADAGDSVAEGDRTVELLIRGIIFDVAAPAAGILNRIEEPPDSIVSSGDILGWLEVARSEQWA